MYSCAQTENSDKGLYLNEGEKWEVNVKTHNGILHFESILEEANKADEATSTDLGALLQNQMNTIFKECTMEGEGHDQLHEVLLPIIREIRTLQKDSLNQQQAKSLQEIAKHLSDYHNYFKVEEL